MPLGHVSRFPTTHHYPAIIHLACGRICSRMDAALAPEMGSDGIVDVLQWYRVGFLSPLPPCPAQFDGASSCKLKHNVDRHNTSYTHPTTRGEMNGNNKKMNKKFYFR